ncbi:protein IMPACT-like [Ostrinia furnacalis]|uniref:protein IMPACT-like n=1 Tax=Ostrinia furnacalis TaxID=93504 RepID=UPI00103A2D99|nr:protein IMPACT-like [Ostrinia furnacalis]
MMMNPQRETTSPTILHSDVIADRRSVFQGHVAPVTCLDDVRQVLKDLKKNKKILNAKHNTFAFRIEGPGGVVENYDDDGEAHAGSKILDLMFKMNARNVVVVVTRWFGGIQIGADRFRHYLAATQQALALSNKLTCAGAVTEGKKSNKNKKCRKKK